jgi:hypothetical protein
MNLVCNRIIVCKHEEGQIQSFFLKQRTDSELVKFLDFKSESSETSIWAGRLFASSDRRYLAHGHVRR